MPTKINYVDEVWNPVVGCSKCSPGCLNCYAEKMAYRLAAMGIPLYDMVQEEGSWNGNIEFNTEALDKPLHWRKPHKILCCSMADLFHPKVPSWFITAVHGIIWRCHQHSFLLLTKRIKEAKEYYLRPEIPELIRIDAQTRTGYFGRPPEWPIPNIHLGVTICTPDELWKANELRKISAAVRFISFEPLLQDMGTGVSHYLVGGNREKIDGVIIGCESGHNRRECRPEWIKSIVKQCKDANANIDWLVKQVEIDGKVCHDPRKCAKWLGV